MNENNIKIKNNAIIHKDNSLNRLDLSFLKHIELEEYKKSELLAYWINDFAVYHDEERNFNISKSGVFSRGDIIKVKVKAANKEAKTIDFVVVKETGDQDGDK